MIFEELNGGACKTYLVGSESTGEAMLVDPLVQNVDRYLQVLEQRGLALRYVVDTHVHADHVSGAALLKQKTGAQYVMHANSVAACVDLRVNEGEVLRLGELKAQVLHTPGHTQDSMTLVLPDRILTGDFLFLGEGGAGRTDLPGGDAGEHWEALQKLAPLSGSLQVYPAHDYHGHTHDTLERERKDNQRLSAWDKGAYVTWLNAQKLGPAEWMKDVVAANYACVTSAASVYIPTDAPSCEVGGTKGAKTTELVPTLSAEQLAEALTQEAAPTVLDVRQPDEYSGELGHVPGATLIPLGELPQRLSELDPQRPVVTVCRSGGRSATAAALLGAAQFQVHSLEGGMQKWRAEHFPVER